MGRSALVSRQNLNLTFDAEAALIEGDVEVIIQALKSFGQRYNVAGMQALRAERYRKSTVDEMRFMERDDIHADN